MTQTPLDQADFLDEARRTHAGAPEFLQALEEITADIWPVLEQTPEYREARILERLSEPDRIIRFRVSWMRDDGSVAINRGWRVQHSNLLGPYKGGLRFHAGVSESEIRFLALEQTVKNALTPLSLGGAKGGSDFDPSGCSEGEIMRFCQAFMMQLAPFIGPRRDIPAGDINVSSREIGYLFGAYRAQTQTFEGALTGKDTGWGGTCLRAEATGYGLVHFASLMAEEAGRSLDGASAAISGAGNVALHAAERALKYGMSVRALSSSQGALAWKTSASQDDIERIKQARKNRNADLESLASELGASWHGGRKAFDIPADVVLPCATQNELDADDAAQLLDQGCWLVAEGANMASTADAMVRLRKADSVLYAPSKAANAGGVAVSGFEMAENARFSAHNPDNPDAELQRVMADIHALCLDHAPGQGDYAAGANIAGFHRVARAMLDQGVA